MPIDSAVKTIATRTTAFVAGAGTALSFTLFSVWERNRYISSQVSPLVHLAAVLLLWVAPAILFVVGFDRKRWDPNYVYAPVAQADYREVGIRTLFWVLGGVVCNLSLGLVI